MNKEFLSIDDVSQYLGIKRSTLYRRVESREIPFYRFGRLIRFRKADVDQWIEGFRFEVVESNSNRVGRRVVGGMGKGRMDIDRIVKKTIDGVRGLKYTSNHGRPDQVEGLRKEVPDGTL